MDEMVLSYGKLLESYLFNENGLKSNPDRVQLAEWNNLFKYPSGSHANYRNSDNYNSWKAIIEARYIVLCGSLENGFEATGPLTKNEMEELTSRTNGQRISLKNKEQILARWSD